MPELPRDRAARVLAADIEAFERVGCRPLERRGLHEVVLAAPAGGMRPVLRLAPVGRLFGGSWGLEVSSDEPLAPPTAAGLSARGRGAVRQRGVRFRARGRGDRDAARLADTLSGDVRLGEALGKVHFERIWLRRDGRPVIRHLGGSVVWVLFPPVVRATPLPADQPAAILAALEAFRAAGDELAAGGSKADGLDTFDA